MIAPFIEYEQLKKLNDIEDVAFERLFTNYLFLNLKGEKKLIDIESTDQESIALKKAIALPGMMYTFINMNETNLAQLLNIKTNETIEFHDITPIVFCTSYNPMHKMMKGLNLNILPNTERLKFLQAFWEHYKQFFEKVEEKTQYQKEAFNTKYIIASIIGKNPELFKLFNKKYNALFNFAYRSYKIENIQNYRMIEYEEWRYIPFYNANTSFRKIGMKQIYQLYNINNKT